MKTHITINVNCLSLDRLFGGCHALIEKARFMEDAGIDGIVLPDHVVFGTGVQYPFGNWMVKGNLAIDSSETWPEPMAMLAAAAAATSKVDLVTNVMIAPLRSTPLLAKQVATLFEISRGRFQLGVGTGWQREEYLASGLSFEQRADFLFDQMRGCRSLWHERPATFSSKHVSFDKIWCSPGLPDPARQRMPLWFGVAPVAANARFFAEFDAGWSCMYPDPEFIAQGLSTLQQTLQEKFGVTRRIPMRAAPKVVLDSKGSPCVQRTIDGLRDSVKAGVTEFDFPVVLMVKEPAKFEPFITALAGIERRIDAYLD